MVHGLAKAVISFKISYKTSLLHIVGCILQQKGSLTSHGGRGLAVTSHDMQGGSRYARANNADDNSQDYFGPSASALRGYYSTQVYYAAARGHLGTLCKLLTEGADPDGLNPEDGLTPLQIAALKGRAACVHRLLVAGADIFATGAQEPSYNPNSNPNPNPNPYPNPNPNPNPYPVTLTP